MWVSVRNLSVALFLSLFCQASLGQNTGKAIRDPFAPRPENKQVEAVAISRPELEPAIEEPNSTVVEEQVTLENVLSTENLASTRYAEETIETNAFPVLSLSNQEISYVRQDFQNDFAGPQYGVTNNPQPLGTAGMFMFSSARNKRSLLGTSDFDAIPDNCSSCDEWLNFCDCGNCGNDLGIDMFRRKAPCRQGRHGCGDPTCNSCGSRSSKAGSAKPAHGARGLWGLSRSSLGPSL